MLVPLLTERTGSNNSAIKDKAKSILKRMITQEKVIPHKDVFLFLMQGLSSKNTKTKSESMEEIHYFLTLYKTEFLSDKETKVIIKLVENNDKALRNNTLNACAEIYRSTGESFWKMADKLLSAKEKDMLKMRFKSVVGLPASGSSAELLEPKQKLGQSLQKSPLEQRRASAMPKFN